MAQVVDIGEYKQQKWPKFSQQRLITESKQQVRHRISRTTKWLLLGTTALVDIVVLVLSFFVAGEVISLVATPAIGFGFFIWFKFLDIPIVENPQVFSRFAISVFVEEIPVVGALPMWTIGMWLIIKMVKSQDEGGIIGSVAGIAQGGVKSNLRKVA